MKIKHLNHKLFQLQVKPTIHLNMKKSLLIMHYVINWTAHI